MTHEQARAIEELAKTEPNHARALSGDNPPKRPVLPQPPYPTAIIVIFGGIIPVVCVVGFIYSLSIYVSDMVSASLDIKTDGFWSLVRGLALLPICYFSFSYARKHRPIQTIEEEAPKHWIPQPFAMELFLHESSFPALKGSISVTLEYEIPSSYQTEAFSNLLAANFDRIASQITSTKLTAYLATGKGLEADARDFLKLLKPAEYEVHLVPLFGRAVYEAQIPVFRFNVRVKLADVLETQPRRRGYMGSSV
jgi:hypothetical protein